MRWKIENKWVETPVKKYLIKWDKPAPSKEAQVVKDFLNRYCRSDVILEEFRIPRTLLRIDFLNLTRKFAIEHAGQQHEKYIEFLHGSKVGFINSLTRDQKKMENILENGFIFIETSKKDFPLTRKFFENYGIIL